jgi:hypothetical protein
MTTVPTPLVRFRGELEAAIERQREAPRRRRRAVVRVALATGAAAAAVAGALTVLPGDPGGRLVEPASAARRAAAALAAAPGSVVHVDMRVTQQNADGSRTAWREQSWQQTAPPYDERRILTRADGERVETATVDGRHELYDARSNTISFAATPATPQPVTAQPFRDQVLDLLRSGELAESGRATVDGRDTITFTGSDGHTRYAYTVDAATYAPVRWQFDPLDTTPAATVAFETYEVVPAADAPLDLTVQHPDATVRR